MPEARTANLSDDPFAGSQIINSHALIKAMAPENVRESQQRLILEPIADRLSAEHPRDLAHRLVEFLNHWRKIRPAQPGYLAGNIINFLGHLKADFHGLNFSNLPIWQACLHDANLHSTGLFFRRVSSQHVSTRIRDHLLN